MGFENLVVINKILHLEKKYIYIDQEHHTSEVIIRSPEAALKSKHC